MSESLTDRVTIRMTPTEREGLERLAEAQGQTLGGTIRWLIGRQLEEYGIVEAEHIIPGPQADELITRIDSLLTQLEADAPKAEEKA